MSRTPRGIAILMVIGILSVLLLLGGLFVEVGRLYTASTLSAAGRIQARLAGGSGLEYGAARLWQDPRPVPADQRLPENAGDDWTFRDAWNVPLGLAPSPSYAHEGATGRLRGPDGRFSLRVASEEGKICLNSGEIGSPAADHDLDGVLNGEDPKYAAEIPPGAYCDPTFWGNVHLVNLLNNLGAVLNLSDVHDEPFGSGMTPIDTIRVSNLGRTVLSRRPCGGYASIEELRPFLSPADFGKVAPFLSTEGEIVPISIPPAPSNPGFLPDTPYDTVISRPDERLEFHARIDFHTAPVEILKSSLRHIASGSGSDPVFIRLIESEADAIAEHLAASRPIHTWKRMLEVLHAAAPTLFEDDPFTKQTDGSPLDDGIHPQRQRLKEDLILAQASANGYFLDPLRWRHNSLEVPREAGTPLDPVVLEPTSIRQILKAHIAWDPMQTWPFDEAGCLLEDVGFTARFPSRRTTEWSLANLPSAFRIESDGRAATSSSRTQAVGTFRLHRGTVTLKSQADFERREARLAPFSLPGGEVRFIGPALRTGTQTLPRFPLDSSMTGSTTYEPSSVPPASPLEFEQHRYSQVSGGIALSAPQRPYAGDLQKTTFSIPFNEDFPDDADTAYDPTRWQDNCFDPVDPANRAGPPASSVWVTYYNWHLMIVPPAGLHPDFHAGFRNSPWGPRTGCASFYWNSDFPLVRGDHNGTGVSGGGEIREGTIECWYPNLGGDARLPLTLANPLTGLHLKYRRPNPPPTPPSEVPYLSLYAFPDGSVRLADSSGAEGTYAPVAPLPWHRLVLRFDASSCPPASDQTRIHVHIDGIESPTPFLLAFGAFPPVDAGMGILTTFPMDDLCLYPSAEATAPLILARAQGNRFVPDGTYTTPRLLFDPVSLPEGAKIRGLSWDGFIPSGTGGLFTFTARGFQADGVTPTGSDTASWSGGAGPQMSRLNVPISRQVEIEVRIETDPAQWPQVVGVPSLRDAPALDELRIVYASGPRWTDRAE